MSSAKFKNRHRLSRKEARAIREQFVKSIGFSPSFQDDSLDVAETEKYTVLLEGHEVVGFFIDDEPYPTVRSLLRSAPEKRFITVDMGAVKFIASGADVMAPGIIAADPKIREGDVVWIRDEKNLRPIAIGKALRSAEAMIGEKKGKAVRNLHHVGDDIWNIG